LGTYYISGVRVIARRALKDFYARHKDAQSQLDAWWHEAKNAKWSSPPDVKNPYRTASLLGNSTVVFNICGNKYRLVVRINYSMQIVFIRFIGTHGEYDRINPEVI
jgi:mRNA interferase HigB